jgi:hypothetical protein
MGVGVCVLYIVVRSVQERLEARRAPGDEAPATAEIDMPPLRARVIAAIGIVGAVAVAAITWSAVQHAIQLFPGTDLPTNKVYEVSTFPFHAWLDSVYAGITPFHQPYLALQVTTRSTVRVWPIVNGMLLAGTIVGAVWAGRGSRLRALGGSALVGMALLGPVFTLVNYVFFHIYFPAGIAPRYGLSVVPAAALVASVCVTRSRWLRLGTAVFAGWVVVITLLSVSRFYA